MRQLKFVSCSVAAVACLVLAGCSGSGGDAGGGAGAVGAKVTNISVDGSSTVYPITEAVAEEFRKVQPNIRVTVGFSGTGGGMKKFIADSIEICDASRPIKDSERKSCEEAGVEFVELEVAFDGLAVVVNPKNDWCDGLTIAQLKEIWRPESAMKNWSDVNPKWPAKEIKLYGPGTDSGTFDYFTKAIVGEEGASRADYTASEDDNVLVTGVREDHYALGYFGYAYYSENADSLKLLGVDGGSGYVKPSEATVRDGSYAPLSRPLFIYVRKSALERPDVQQFVRFYLDSIDELTKEVGYVPISAEAVSRNEAALGN